MFQYATTIEDIPDYEMEGISTEYNEETNTWVNEYTYAYVSPTVELPLIMKWNMPVVDSEIKYVQVDLGSAETVTLNSANSWRSTVDLPNADYDILVADGIDALTLTVTYRDELDQEMIVPPTVYSLSPQFTRGNIGITVSDWEQFTEALTTTFNATSYTVPELDYFEYKASTNNFGIGYAAFSTYMGGYKGNFRAKNVSISCKTLYSDSFNHWNNMTNGNMESLYFPDTEEILHSNTLYSGQELSEYNDRAASYAYFPKLVTSNGSSRTLMHCLNCTKGKYLSSVIDLGADVLFSFANIESVNATNKAQRVTTWIIRSSHVPFTPVGTQAMRDTWLANDYHVDVYVPRAMYELYLADEAWQKLVNDQCVNLIELEGTQYENPHIPELDPVAECNVTLFNDLISRDTEEISSTDVTRLGGNLSYKPYLATVNLPNLVWCATVEQNSNSVSPDPETGEYDVTYNMPSLERGWGAIIANIPHLKNIVIGLRTMPQNSFAGCNDLEEIDCNVFPPGGNMLSNSIRANPNLLSVIFGDGTRTPAAANYFISGGSSLSDCPRLNSIALNYADVLKLTPDNNTNPIGFPSSCPFGSNTGITDPDTEELITPTLYVPASLVASYEADTQWALWLSTVYGASIQAL